MEQVLLDATNQTFSIRLSVNAGLTVQQAQEVAENFLSEMVYDSSPVGVDIKSLSVQLQDDPQLVEESSDVVWVGSVQLQLSIDPELAAYADHLEEWAQNLSDWHQELNAYLAQGEDQVSWARIN